MPLQAPLKRKSPPLSYREFRLEVEPPIKKTAPEETISPNRSEDYSDKSEMSEEIKSWNKVNIGPDKQLFHEPQQHFPGLYPVQGMLTIRAVKKTLDPLGEKKRPALLYFGPKRLEPNFDNVDVYDTDNRKKDVKYGPTEKAREFDYDGSLPKAERGQELEYETPTPYLGDAWIGTQMIFGPHL